MGKVYLVGAGPGDPELITIKALKLIRNADVIVYDRLIPHELLSEARPDAELIDVGKAPTKHRTSQDGIHDILLEEAKQGKQVVRLKGGDPFIFGRGGEEGLFCHLHNIPFEVVPGISSSYAVPAYAGIPLTHRHISTNFTVITGHEADKLPYEALVKLGGTLVILMGANNLQTILDCLQGSGLASETSAISIEWGTTPKERIVEGTVANLSQRAIDANLQSPAITVIGDVVKLREQGLKWFNQGQLSEGLLNGE